MHLNAGKLYGVYRAISRKSDLCIKLPWLEEASLDLISLVCFDLKQAFANPEDTASFGKGDSAKKFLRTDADVERVRR